MWETENRPSKCGIKLIKGRRVQISIGTFLKVTMGGARSWLTGSELTDPKEEVCQDVPRWWTEESLANRKGCSRCRIAAKPFPGDSVSCWPMIIR